MPPSGGQVLDPASDHGARTLEQMALLLDELATEAAGKEDAR